jgi:DNA repair protein RadC
MNATQITFITDAERKTRDIMKSSLLQFREQVTESGTFDTLTDVQTIATVLSMVKGGSADPVATAEKLLDSFGSIKGIMEARPEQIAKVDGMTAARADMISMIRPLVRLWFRCNQEVPDRIGNSREAENYCLSLLAAQRNEKFYVVCLSAKCGVIGRRCISEGSLAEVSAYPRMVMETVLNYNAHSVLLCHNHPGGTCAPSPEDISSTLQLQRLLNGVGVLVLDHIIVANDKTYSMIQHGDIDYRIKAR